MTAVLALFLLLAPGLAGLGRGGILPLVGAALAMALYCSLFCGLCCLLTEGAAGCGTASFALALAFLALIPYLAFWGAAALAPAVRWSPVALYLRAGGGWRGCSPCSPAPAPPPTPWSGRRCPPA